MTRAKTIFIYCTLGVFVATAVVGICAAIGLIKLVELPTAAALLTPCISAVIALINAKHLFDDPEAITKLKHEQHDMIARLKDTHAKEMAIIMQSHAQNIAMRTQLEKTQRDQILTLQKNIARMGKERPGSPPMSSIILGGG